MPNHRRLDTYKLNKLRSKKKKVEDMTVLELKALAKELQIKGYSKMNKEDLIKAILKAQQESEQESESTGTIEPEIPEGEEVPAAEKETAAKEV